MVRPGEVVAAYRRALYRVERGFDMRVGGFSPALAALYREFDCDCAAFLTAYNPGSVKKPDTVNHTAQFALIAAVDAMGLPWLSGIGLDSDPCSDWPGEPSVLAMGIQLASACRLAQRFEQLALLWCPASAIPELRFVDVDFPFPPEPLSID